MSDVAVVVVAVVVVVVAFVAAFVAALVVAFVVAFVVARKIRASFLVFPIFLSRVGIIIVVVVAVFRYFFHDGITREHL